MIGSRFARGIGLVAVWCMWIAARPAPAQVREPGAAVSAGAHAGPLTDIILPLTEDGAAVHDGSQTIGDASGGPTRTDTAPVDDGNDRTVLSGPVASISRGPVDALPASIAPAVEEASTGAVTHDIASPLGEQISEPLRDLGPLRAQMRKQREEAQRIALQHSIAPAVTDLASAADAAPGGDAAPAAEAAPGPEAAPAAAAAPAPDAAVPADAAPSADAAAAQNVPEEHADAEFTPPSDGLDPEGDLHGEDAPAPDDSDSSN